jgi:methyl-accepting chemotaxis protein
MEAVAREIAEVTQLISGIAAQTNLLALNATIEAARAGEAGRGFSVVAQEVKGLASQTASATQDIATRIQAMQTATGRSVSAIQGISLRIKDLENLSARIAAAVEEQGAATREIAGSVASAAVGVGHVERSMAEISTLAETNVGAVSEVGTAANQVVGQTRILRTRLHAFTEDIRRMSA